MQKQWKVHSQNKQTCLQRNLDRKVFFTNLLASMCGAIILLLSTISFSYATTSDTTRVIYGFDRDFPPFSYETPGGSPTGFEVELVKAIFAGTKTNVVFRPIDWQQVPLELATGAINISTGMVKTEQRSKLYLFANAPTFHLQIRLFTKVYKRVPSLAMLRGQMVSVDEGSYQQRILENFGGINIKPFSGKVDGLRELYNDAVAAYCGPIANTYYYINKLNYGAITTVGTPISTADMHIAINRNRGDIQKLVNQGMMRVIQSGEYERIYRKWFVRELTNNERTILVQSALKASIPSYVPYTGKGIGAAVLSASGKVYTACVMENADPMLSISALRATVTKAISEGDFELRAAVSVTTEGQVVQLSPEDLQSLFEMGRGILVIQQANNTYSESMVSQLLSDPVTKPFLPPSGLGAGVTPLTIESIATE